MPDAIGPGPGAKPRPIGSLWGYGRRVAQGSGFLGEVRTLSKWSGSSLSFMNWSKVMSRAMANAGVSTNKPTPALFRWEASMTAFNVVRLRVKPGREQEFLDAHQPQNVRSKWRG